MSQMYKMCAGHLTLCGDALRKRDLFKHVRPDRTVEFMAAWLAGTARREDIDPLVVLILELHAKAQRMGCRAGGRRCSVCLMADKVRANPKASDKVRGDPAQVLVDGQADAVLLLMRANGRAPGDVEAIRQEMIEKDRAGSRPFQEAQ